MKLFKHCYFVILCLLLTSTLIAQNGTITGVVTDLKTGETVPFANVSSTVDGNLIGTQTDFDGNFSLELPAGTHEIKISYLGYTDKVLTQTVADGQTSTVTVEMGESEELLKEVVVTATKGERLAAEETVSISVIKPTSIGNANDTQVDQTIEKVPGVDVIDGQANIRGGSGYSYGAGSRVMLLMDGLPVLTADAGFPNWDFLPIENVSQIEIIKGASSALYGSSAMNGIINLITAYPTTDPVTKFSIFGGIYDKPRDNEIIYHDSQGNPTDSILTKSWWGNQYEDTLYTFPVPFESGISLAHRQKFGKLDVSAGTYLYASNTWRHQQKQRRGRANLNLRYRPENLKGLSFGLNTNFMLNTSVSWLIWDYQPNPLEDNYNPAGGYQLWRATPPINNNGLKLTLDPFVEYYTENGLKIKWLNRYFKNNNQNDTNQSTNSDFFYTELQAQKRFLESDFMITAGVVNSVALSNSDLYRDLTLGEETKYSSSNLATYLQLDKKFFDNLNASVGFRYESNAIKNVADDNSRLAEAKPVFRAGLNYQAAEYTYLRASFGQAYRFPTIAEKYVRTDLGAVEINGLDFDIGIYPNRNLISETGWSAELGVKQGFKISNWKGFIDASGFINEYTDMMEFTFGISDGLLPIVRDGIIIGADTVIAPIWPELDTVVITVPEGGSVGFQSINIGDTRIFGADITIAGEGDLFGLPTRALFGYTYVLPKFQDFNEVEDILSSADRNILKYRFQHTFKLDGETTLFNKLSLGSSMRFYSHMEAIDEAFNKFLPGIEEWRAENNGGTFVMDARLLYNLTEKSTISFVSKNVFNNEYSLRPSLMDAPRSFTLKYSAEF